MFHLILKEFLIQKKTMLYSFIYTLIAGFAFENMWPGGGSVYIIAPVAVIYMLVIYSCGFDEKNGVDIIFNSLPLKRDDIVIAKYSSVFFFASFGLLCSVFIGVLGITTGFANIKRFITLSDIVIVISIGLVFASIFYPLYYKFGLNKMKIVNIFLLLIPMFLPSLIGDYLKSHTDTDFVKVINSAISNASVWTLQALGLIVACIIFLISILVSMNIYRNKDL